MNKIEKALEKIIEKAKKFNNHDQYSLIFLLDYNGENEVQLLFNLEQNSSDLYLSFIKFCENRDNQFTFQLPINYVSDFIAKHLNDKTYLNSLNYSKEHDLLKIDKMYSQFLDKINDNPNFFHILLPSVLENELFLKDSLADKKKLKI